MRPMIATVALSIFVAPLQGQEIADAHGGTVTGLRFFQKNPRLASSGFDGKVNIWNTSKLEKIGSYAFPFKIYSFDLSPSEKSLLVGGFDFNVHLLEMETGKRQIFKFEDPRVNSVFFMDEKFVCVSIDSGDLLIFETETGKRMKSLSHAGAVRMAGMSSDGKSVISCGKDGWVKFWSPTDFSLQKKVFVVEGMRVFATNKNCSILAVSDNQDVLLRSLTENKLLSRLKGHAKPVSVLTFVNAKHEYLVSGSHDGVLYKWDLKTGESSALCRSELKITCFSHDQKTNRFCLGSIEKKMIFGELK